MDIFVLDSNNLLSIESIFSVNICFKYLYFLLNPNSINRNCSTEVSLYFIFILPYLGTKDILFVIFPLLTITVLKP